MDLFCRVFNILNFYTFLAQNALQFGAQKRVILYRHVPRQHGPAGILEAEIHPHRAPVENVAEQVFYLVHLRTVAGGHGQEIPGGPSPACLTLDALHAVHAKVFTGVVGLDGLHALDDQAGGLVLLDGDAAIGDHNGVFLQGRAATPAAPCCRSGPRRW